MAEIESVKQQSSPIRKSVVVRRTPQEAFDIFTKRIGSWWPFARYSIYQADAVGCVIEPRIGGKVQESAKNGDRAIWGTVTIWEPPQRFAMTWHPGSDPANATDLEIRFIQVTDGTRVELEHRNWTKLGARAEETRSGYDSGWVDVFEGCYVKACA